jgi:hypothetical protein
MSLTEWHLIAHRRMEPGAYHFHLRGSSITRIENTQLIKPAMRLSQIPTVLIGLFAASVVVGGGKLRDRSIELISDSPKPPTTNIALNPLGIGHWPLASATYTWKHDNPYKAIDRTVSYEPESYDRYIERLPVRSSRPKANHAPGGRVTAHPMLMTDSGSNYHVHIT